MEKKKKKAADAVKQAANQANRASENRELDIESLAGVTGGGEFDEVPTVDEHDYDPNDQNRY